MRASALAPLALAAVVLFLPSALAADPGQMESVDLEATPAAQGLGGPFEVTVRVEFATDPHATLIVTDLTVELSVPPGLAVVIDPAYDDNPVLEARVDLPPTQSFLVRTYQWKLTAVAIGLHEVSARVTTDSSGGGDASANVTVREGIVIGQLVASPTGPTVSDALHFELPVTSGFDEATSPLQVWLYIYQSPELVHPSSANGSALQLTNGDTVRGAGFPMEEEDGTYRYDVPAQPRGTLIYWVNAQTPHSNTTTKAVLMLVDDPAVSGAVSIGALATVLALGAAGVAYIIWDPASRKKPSGSIHNSPDRVRMALLVLAIGGAAFAAAVLTGALNGLWTRMGYA